MFIHGFEPLLFIFQTPITELNNKPAKQTTHSMILVISS